MREEKRQIAVFSGLCSLIERNKNHKKKQPTKLNLQQHRERERTREVNEIQKKHTFTIYREQKSIRIPRKCIFQERGNMAIKEERNKNDNNKSVLRTL